MLSLGRKKKERKEKNVEVVLIIRLMELIMLGRSTVSLLM